MKGAILFAALLAITGCSRKAEPPAEPREQNAPESSRTVEMKKAAQAQVGVVVMPAAMTSLKEYLTVTGTVQPEDSRVAHVFPIARGRVEEILARVGDRVRAGQPLARFDNLEAGALIAEYRAAESELRKLRIERQAASQRTERNRRLVDLGAVPRKDYEASQAEEQSAAEAVQGQESVAAGMLARLRRFGVNPSGSGAPVAGIPAPISGIVIGVSVAPGEVIEAGKELFTIADISTVWVQAEVYEKDLGQIKTGQAAAVHVDTYGDRQFNGKVTYIGDVLDPKTRTVKVRCEIPNPQALLKLDMFATISLPTILERQAIAVAESAIQQVNGKPIVFVRRSEEVFEARPVELGMKVGGLVEVSSGVSTGDLVAAQGSFHLKSVLLEKEIKEEE
jgi:cobalt-zinc-cadmium efflux system membrane fusion protein